MTFNEKTFYQIMVFYSLVTFFAGPKIAKSMKLDTKDPCFMGMIAGFVVSMVLWKQFGYSMSYGKAAATY